MANDSNVNKTGTIVANTAGGFGATAVGYKAYTDPKFANQIVDGLNTAKDAVKNTASNVFSSFSNSTASSVASSAPEAVTSARDVASQAFENVTQATSNYTTAGTEYINAMNELGSAGVGEMSTTAVEATEEALKQAATNEAAALAEYNQAIEQLASEGAPSIPEFTNELAQTIETAEGTLGVDKIEEVAEYGAGGTGAAGVAAPSLLAQVGIGALYALPLVELELLWASGVAIGASSDMYAASATDNQSNINILKTDIIKLQQIRKNAEGDNR